MSTPTTRFGGLLPLLLLLAACTEQAPPEPVRPALVVQAGAGGAGVQVYAGEVHAREEPSLAFRIPGKLLRRHVDAGARVKAGQALAELDPADVRLQSEADRAALAAAEADLALAQSEADRYRNLAERQLVSRSALDSRMAQLQSAQARVRQARSAVAGSRNQVGYAVLRAPRDGVIAQRLAEAGQVVAAGQAIFVLAVEGEREVVIAVPEHQAARFAVGQPMAVELWAMPGRRFAGKVREIAPAADAQTRTFAARVAFDAAGAPVELGQSARVYARVGERAPAPRVPLSALSEAGGRPAVWKLDPATSKVHRVAVRIGPYGEDGVPVLAGLRAGDWVVAAGVHLLQEGERVAPVDRDNRPIRAGVAKAP